MSLFAVHMFSRNNFLFFHNTIYVLIVNVWIFDVKELVDTNVLRENLQKEAFLSKKKPFYDHEFIIPAKVQWAAYTN